MAKGKRVKAAKYCYYVVYQSLKGTASQLSCSIIERDHPIDSTEEVAAVGGYLQQQNGLQAVILMNWILLVPGTIPAVTLLG